MVDLNQLVRELVAKDVVVEFIAERVTFEPGAADPFVEFQLNSMASLAQLERAIIKERQADSIRAAKARGVYKGRPRRLTDVDLARARESIDAGVPKRRSPAGSASTARRCTARSRARYRAR